MNIAVQDLDRKAVAAKAIRRQSHASVRLNQNWGTAAFTLVLSSALIVFLVWGWNQSEHRLISAGDVLGSVLAIVGTVTIAFMFIHTLIRIVRTRSIHLRLRLSFRLQMVIGFVGPACVLSQSGLGSATGIVASCAMVLMAFSALAGRYVYSRTRRYDRHTTLTPRNLVSSFGRWLKLVRLARRVRRQLGHSESARERTHLFRIARLHAKVFSIWQTSHVVILTSVAVTALTYVYTVLPMATLP
ncbi:MAG: hypothetical protein O7G84_06325 [Gammaproteobacteria bacterium]|nr:hypothetical protein [Gammaproteobacteria bacterium]